MKKLLAIIFVLFAASGCTTIASTETTHDGLVQFYVRGTDADGKTLFEVPIRTSQENVFDAIVESGQPIDYEDSAYGPFVTGIGAIKAGDGEYIALYVDGEYAQTGIKDIPVKEGSIVDFRVEKIEDY